MSGIYIKGMEMPKGCATCPYCDRAWNKPKCKVKSVQGRFMEQRLNLDRTRQKWCPIIPIPDHGRLIDADAFIKDECNYCDGACEALPCDCTNCHANCRCDFMLHLLDAQTIIPGKEVDNG